jgi:hypothetical protein
VLVADRSCAALGMQGANIIVAASRPTLKRVKPILLVMASSLCRRVVAHPTLSNAYRCANVLRHHVEYGLQIEGRVTDDLHENNPLQCLLKTKLRNFEKSLTWIKLINGWTNMELSKKVPPLIFLVFKRGQGRCSLLAHRDTSDPCLERSLLD